VDSHLFSSSTLGSVWGFEIKKIHGNYRGRGIYEGALTVDCHRGGEASRSLVWAGRGGFSVLDISRKKK